MFDQSSFALGCCFICSKALCSLYCIPCWSPAACGCLRDGPPSSPAQLLFFDLLGQDWALCKVIATPSQGQIPPEILFCSQVHCAESLQFFFHPQLRPVCPENIDWLPMLVVPCALLPVLCLRQHLHVFEARHRMRELRLETPSHNHHGVGRLVNQQTPLSVLFPFLFFALHSPSTKSHSS